MCCRLKQLFEIVVVCKKQKRNSLFLYRFVFDHLVQIINCDIIKDALDHVLNGVEGISV